MRIHIIHYKYIHNYYEYLPTKIGRAFKRQDTRNLLGNQIGRS